MWHSPIPSCVEDRRAWPSLAGQQTAWRTADSPGSRRAVCGIRQASLDGLARFVREVAEKRGHVSAAATDAFLEAGWSRANLVDAIMVVGDKSISNYLHGTTKIPVDFPAAEKLVA